MDKTEYNGHPNRHYWSVALNINNVQSLYELARIVTAESKNTTAATLRFLQVMKNGEHLTTEGYRFTFRTVFRALFTFGRRRYWTKDGSEA